MTVGFFNYFIYCAQINQFCDIKEHVKVLDKAQQELDFSSEAAETAVKRLGMKKVKKLGNKARLT